MNDPRYPAAADPLRWEGFRAVLAEYDIVATGIRTLMRRLEASATPQSDALRARLQALELHYGFQREPLWRLQVGDDALSALLEELWRRGRGEDPLFPLSDGLDRVKRILSPLALVLEDLPQRDHETPEAISVQDHSALKDRNFERMAYHLAFGHDRLDSLPVRYILDVTSRCNFRCVTCHQSQTQDVIHYDLAEVPMGAVTSGFAAARQVFVAGMGEPLLSRSAFELATAAKASGAYVELVTNGSTLGRGTRLLPAVDFLMISIDGGDAQSFDAIRRNGSFEKLAASLHELEPESRRKLCFNVVVCKQNVFSLQGCVDLGVELGIGHIHLQEMGLYLPWHGEMAVSEAERAWLFDQLPGWQVRAAEAGISLICNLVRGPSSAFKPDAAERAASTRSSLEALRSVPMAMVPRRRSIEEVSDAVEELLATEAPAVFRAVGLALRRMCTPEVAAAPAPDSGGPDWLALRDFVESDGAAFPHCIASFAHMIVNGDGTTRSCCTVQNRLADVSQPSLGTVWNSPAYAELRARHTRQQAPRAACRNCRDPVRFHFLPEILGVLVAHDIDITLIRKPADFPVPSSAADHPLVQALGSNALNSSV